MTTQTAVFVSAVLLASATTAMAAVKLPAIFGDNMVIQRDAAVNIWGWAAPGEEVAVTCIESVPGKAGPDGAVMGMSVVREERKAVADDDGKWKIQLNAIKASDKPITIEVKGKSNAITLKNVLVGDVWLGSGQSNMEMAVASCNNAQQEIASADLPKIRLFAVPRKVSIRPETEVAGQWVECSPKTVGRFSAALFFFGRDLHKKLNVPMGLVHSSWGGTPIEAWTSRAGYEATEQIKPILNNWDNAVKAYEEKLKADPKTPPIAGSGRPTCLYNAMIAPLVPLTIRGVTWYQGESNAGRYDLYAVQMPAMIADWRKQFGQHFPFIMVQLANYKARVDQPVDQTWPRLREAQSKTAAADPLVGIAVITDAGDAKDIHPKNKQAVGARLALQARKIAYGEEGLVADGPTFKSMKVEGDKVRVTFDNVGGGLEPRQRSDVPAEEGELRLHGFAIASEDHKFHWADATIDGSDVILSSKDVAKPIAIRYGWADNPDGNLYNKEGLPASPFRTDDWPMGK